MTIRSRWNPWRGLERLPREIWVLAGATFVNRAGTMVLPFLVLYVTRHLGFPVGFGGLSLAVYGVASLVAAPVSGKLCDRWGPVPVMRASLAASAAILAVFPVVRSGVTVLLATVALSLASEGFRPASMAIVTETAASHERKAAFALIRLAANLGMSVGPAAGGFLAAVSFPALFWVDGVTALVAAGILTIAIPGRGRRHDTARDGMREPLGTSGHRNARLIYFLAAGVLIGIVFFQHISTMPLFLVRDLGLRESVYGLMFTLNTLLIVLLEVPLNLRMADWPHRRSLALGALLVAAGFGAMALALGALSIAATVVVWTFGEMILLPGMSAYVAEISPRGRSGEYMGLYMMAFGTAFAIGPWLGTETLDRLGGRALWGIMFVIGAVSAGMMARLREPRERPV